MNNLEEAVREIERLKAELVEEKAMCNGFRLVVKNLKAEIERKDGLLQEVYDAARADWRFSDDRISYVEPQLCKSLIDEIAEALTEEDK